MQYVFKVFGASVIAVLTLAVVTALRERPVGVAVTAPVNVAKSATPQQPVQTSMHSPIVPADPFVPEHSMRRVIDY